MVTTWRLTKTASLVAHLGIPGLAPYIAMGLFFLGSGAAVGAHWLITQRTGVAVRTAGIGLGVIAFGCFGVATAFPLIIHASPTLTRPSSNARLQILSPRPGEVIRGDPAAVRVELRLEGGRIVPLSSLHLIPNAGHIHLYLDSHRVSMTGLDTEIQALPGRHTLRAEFVAVDHGPFRPNVDATVTFDVLP